MRLHLAALLLVAVAAPLPAFDIGDRAPGLDGVEWVKGEAPALGAGVPAVVEFWSTWSAPCREAIPDLTTLQDRGGEQLIVIGLSSEPVELVRAFVEARGDAMEYRVGAAPAAVESAWMSGVGGVPQAFLVDGGGRVVWRGHPSAIDAPLARLRAGTLDLDAVRRALALEDQLERTLAQPEPQLDRALALTGELLAVDPLHALAIDLRLTLASNLGRPDIYRATLEAIPTVQLPAAQACRLARARLTDPRIEQRHLDLALAWAARAHELAPDDPEILATWALALGELGLFDAAIAAQNRAVALAPQDRRQRDALDYLSGAAALARAYASAK